MKRIGVLALLPLALFLGCKMKPTKVTEIPGPSPEVFFTVEVWEDSGAVSSDFTRVFAHFDHEGKRDRVMFLDGPYLELSSVRWNSKNEVTLCISGGRVNSFKENVSLHAGDATYEIRNHLDPGCHQQQP
jgi:hypothetical protein